MASEKWVLATMVDGPRAGRQYAVHLVEGALLPTLRITCLEHQPNWQDQSCQYRHVLYRIRPRVVFATVAWLGYMERAQGRPV